MFRLEKVFQNDDSLFIILNRFFSTFIIFLVIYFFSILKENTIFDIYNLNIFLDSEFFNYSVYLSISFFILRFFSTSKKYYKKDFISFLKIDISNFILSNISSFSLIFIFNKDIQFNLSFLFLNIILLIALYINKLLFNYFYENLIKKNFIQKNILLVGAYNDVINLIHNKSNELYIYKCCIITDLKNHNKLALQSEIKFPIFNENEDIRAILEYHALGQIWILDNRKNEIKNIFKKIIKYPVDTLHVKMFTSPNLLSKKLLLDKYEFEYYELSKFYGFNLFLKLFIDKFLSLIFLFFLFPVLIICSFLIFIEDGLPIFFIQNRTGWDGRRFKLYKLRSLYNKRYDPKIQIEKVDNRKLKIGNFIRRYSIDEIPQFLNVLKGEMSIVGPRPHPVSLDLSYANLYESFLTRYRCNPGLTGWSQINGFRGPTKNPEFMKKRMDLDIWYLNNWSLALDLYIIFRTFYAIFKHKGD